jgi:hypothetical protein
MAARPAQGGAIAKTGWLLTNTAARACTKLAFGDFVPRAGWVFTKV